jgi:DNA polymerase-3 subunit gamma/tau
MAKSYEVMARRWRPQTFEEVEGQQAVVRTLRNAVAQGRLAHALLFAGPRGVGKTTTARLLAKALNCVRGPTADPCGECESCAAVKDGRLLNVLEIDGASHNRVEEARDLIETVQYAPGPGRWRVVIVDEVHMLSTAAFNALLKTVEEPPPNVVFVLATTEPHKVPATIHSRCQRHDFRRLTAREIVDGLAKRLRGEGLTVPEEALRAIARAAQGSLRDAQSLLEQILAYAGPSPTPEDVEASLGLVRADRLAEAADAIAARATDKALALVDSLHREGHDLRLFCQELVATVRDLAVVKVCQRPGPLLEDSRVPEETLRKQAAGLTLAEIELMQKALLQAEQEMRRAAAPRLALEMALIRLGDIRSLEPVPDLIRRLRELEQQLGVGAAPPPPPAAAELPLFAAASPAPPTAARASAPPPRPAPAPGTPAESAAFPAPAPVEPLPAPPATADAGAGWQRARHLLGPRKKLAAVLAESEAVLQGDTLEVTVGNGSGFVRQMLEEPEARRVVGEAVREAFGGRLSVTFSFRAARPAAPAACGPGAAPAEHARVREALEIFEGRIAPTRENSGAPS